MEMPANTSPSGPLGTVDAADRARRAEFLRVANRCWLAMGGVALAAMHFYPTELIFFTILISVTAVTFVLVDGLNRSGRTRLGGMIFCFLVDATVYGLLLLNFHVHGFQDLEATLTRVSGYAFMGTSILFAGAVIGAGAAFGFALLNTTLLAATAVFVDSRLGPKISIPCFWWILAVAVWLYERHVSRALRWLREAHNSLERRVDERTLDLRRAMDQRDRAAREADAANADLESFSYSAAHDLRGPLRRIAGFVDILQEDYGARIEDGGQEILRALRSQSTRASQLIEDLLRLARIGRAPLVPVVLDVSALVREIADDLESKDPGRDVEWAIEPGLQARADGGLARVVFENLLGNAWKFTSKRVGARIDVGSTGDGFFVRDNGAGFDPALGERLFQPFQRLHTEAEFSGSGIGLATVARIVRRHGGTISAAGEVGKGATFTFRFEGAPAADSGD